MPPAAPAPGSSLTARPAAAFNSTAQSLSRSLQHAHGVGVGPLLRAEHGRRAHRSEQRMLDVGGCDELDARQQLAGRRQGAKLLDDSPTAVGAGAAAEPDHDPPGARLHRGGDQLSHSPAVSSQRRLHGRRAAKQRQPAGLRALDVGGRGRGRVEHPLRGHLVGQRAASREACEPHRSCLPARRRSRVHRRTAGQASTRRRGGRGASRPRSHGPPRPR